jgi:hypothetical protein
LAVLVLVAGGEGFEAEEQAEWKLPTPKKQPGETALGSDRIRLSAAADEPSSTPTPIYYLRHEVALLA